jgi:hypothetical protein
MAQSLPFGQILLTLPVLQILLAAYFTDVVGTHVCNPAWDSHARYHEAQTMDILIFLEVLTLYLTWRSLFLTSVLEKKDSLYLASLSGSAFLVSGILAPFFPGKLCEGTGVSAGEPGTPGNWIYGVPLVVNWVGYALAVRQTEHASNLAQKKK